MEPQNPERYFIAHKVKMLIEGKHVKAEIKKWFDTETQKYEEKILSYEEDSTYV
jgi:hypothetical protein